MVSRMMINVCWVKGHVSRIGSWYYMIPNEFISRGRTIIIIIGGYN